MKLRSLLNIILLASLYSHPISGLCAPELPGTTSATTPLPKRFNFADIRRRAEVLATQPFDKPGNVLPDFLQKLDYNQYRNIRFRAEKSLWRDQALPFEIQFAPLGFLFKQPVLINVIDQGESTPIAYSNDLFDFGKNKVPEHLPEDLAFSGFKVLYPLHTDHHYDEVAVFLGASYFRAVGQQQTYGLSLRGLAIDTGLSKPEEFPFFREFWLEKPDKDATELTVYALMDSQSLTGAYRFRIRPGVNTIIDVKSNIFIRESVQKFGVAPLTSMFFHGTLNERFFDDFRPQVHDSEGLLINNGNNEWIWRPLSNPSKLRISAFVDENPRGFGLLQRDRDFQNYQDLEAHYHQRPSVWVEPLGDWGKGTVQLIEIPSDAERYDNIAVFWTPYHPAEAGQQREYDYRLYFFRDMPISLPYGYTLSSRVGQTSTGQHRHFVIDFGGKALAALPKDAQVKAIISSTKGTIHNVVVQRNPYTQGQRVSFELSPEEARSVEIRCFLQHEEQILTEIWSYQWIKAQ